MTVEQALSENCYISLSNTIANKKWRRHPTGEEGQNWPSKICGGPLWLMVNTFFIGEELRKKDLFVAPFKENDMVI